MIHWKLDALSFTAGALAAVGFVFLGRSRIFSRRRFERRAPERLAREDALRDLETYDVDLESMSESVGVDTLGDEFGEAAEANEDRYDAMDPDEMGTEFLRRATEAAPQSPEDRGVSPDTLGDVAEELPVGSIDDEGNTELRPERRSEKHSAELSPNEQELAERAADIPGAEGSKVPDA